MDPNAQKTIVYVGSLAPGGTCLMRMRALQSLGHKVIGIDIDSQQELSPFVRAAARLMWRLGRPLDLSNVNERLLSVVKRIRPVAVWIDKGLSIRPEVLAEIRKQDDRTRIVGYSPDDMGQRHNQSTYFLKGLPKYDWFFTTKTFNVEELRTMGAKRPSLVGNGYDPDTHRPVSISGQERETLGGPVGFIGSYERERAAAILALAQAGFRVRVWGWGRKSERWMRHPNLRIEDRHLMALEYATGIHSFDINLGFLRKANRDRQTTRSIEIPACEAFMLAERTDEHLALFEEGKEAEFFGSEQEMIEKVKFYLRNESLRRKIAIAGRQRCLRSGYDYPSRMRMILEQVLRNNE